MFVGGIGVGLDRDPGSMYVSEIVVISRALRDPEAAVAEAAVGVPVLAEVNVLQ